jgi:predicted dehydrogenase
VPGYEVRACSSSTAESAKAAAAAHGIPVACADHLELVARDDVDLVVVSVKVPEHHRLVSAAIDAGKAILCEWPLGNGDAEADDLAARAAAAGVPAFVGLQARCAPAVRAVRELVRNGRLGEILSSSLVGTGEQWGPTVAGANVYLVDAANGATLLTVPFGHAIDAVCHTLGEFSALDAVTATRRPRIRRTDTDELIAMTAEDHIVVGGTLTDGTVLSAHYRGGRSAGDNFTWTIVGTEGEALVTGATGHLQFGQVAVLVTEPGSRALRPYEIPAALRATDMDPTSRANTVAEAYAHLLAGLRGEPTLVPAFAEAARRQHLLAAIQRAAAVGAREYFPSQP